MELVRPDANDGRSKAGVGRCVVIYGGWVGGWVDDGGDGPQQMQVLAGPRVPRSNLVRMHCNLVALDRAWKTRTVLVFCFKIRVFNGRGIYWAR